jgi:hypothetical protein
VAAPFSIADPQAVPADRVLEWVVAPAVPEDPEVQAPVAPCTQPARRPAVLVDPGSVPAWERAPASAPVLDLASAPAWVAHPAYRLRAKRRVRHVRARVAVAVRVTRRAKKVR